MQCYHYASSSKSCYIVAIQETVDVPANSEMIVSGESYGPIFRGLAGLIEPNEKFMEKNGLLVARSIVHPEIIIIQWKIDEVKPIWADVSHMSPEVKFYWSRLNSLILVNGILYRKWESYNGKHYDLHIVLPANFKRFVLNQVHNTVTGGHLGVRKTLSKIKQRYFWYKMRQDVKFWCTKCDICASKKAPCKKPKAPMKQYLVGAPWERMAIDILGPLPISVNNNRYLMVVQDYFSKWTEAIPIPDTEAVTVAKEICGKNSNHFWGSSFNPLRPRV
ncbi:Hypothetical predicted protein [Mytilus galloprovincialis]|uniref:Integrase zinc-binding domain-containing protein n=1 Tax=Mytilus galloprovincialis TaxID=29158 RepID=A0A8B6CMP6_MYTGA|nr:Hypothetical predicted protein [Mytilus galloprovincialis]